MFSFKTLFVAGLAAVASVSAAPCAERRHDQPEVDTAAVTSVIASTSTISTTISLTSTASAVVASATGAVPATGSEQPASVTDILNDVMAQIKPLTDTLSEHIPAFHCLHCSQWLIILFSRWHDQGDCHRREGH